MPNEIVDEIRSVVSEIKNQLKFYKDIGLEDIELLNTSKGAPRAVSAPSASLPTEPIADPAFEHLSIVEAVIPQESIISSQASTADAPVGLFGESLSEPSSKSVTRRAVALPVLESKDSSL